MVRSGRQVGLDYTYFETHVEVQETLINSESALRQVDHQMFELFL